VKIVFLAIAGGLGTLARYAVDGFLSSHPGRSGWPASFPLGTLAVNVSGCFLLGVLAALAGQSLDKTWLRGEWRDVWMIGFCGGYTTFSSYALQTLNLARDAQWAAGALNVAASNVLGLAAVYGGSVCGLLLPSMRARG
jgi:CrcB protein